MEFPKKYQLIELLPGSGVQSYRARQTNTGRDVTVHLLVGGKTPENEVFLVRLRAMQPHSMAKLIEVGEYEGATFVVTVAPPYQRLDEWLAEQDRADAAAKEFGKAGFWKRPEVGSLAPPPPAKAPAAPATLSEPGEFTKQFQRAAAPAPEPGLPLTAPVRAADPTPASATDEFAKLFSAPTGAPLSAAPADAGALGGAGEFTKMFQGGVAPPAAEPVLPAVPAAAPVRPTPAQTAEAGEFTKLFQSPVAPAAAEPSLPAVPAASAAPVRPTPAQSAEAGEFTKLFQSPVAPAAEPSLPAVPAASAPPVRSTPAPTAEAGEFTKLFQSPAVPPAAEHSLPAAPAASAAPVRSAPAQPAEAGEFTKLFQSPVSPPAAEPSLPSTPAVSAPAAPASPAAGPGEFTRLFHAPPPPPAAAPPAGIPVKPAGPGEFTRMFDSSLPDVPAPGDWPAPAPKPHAPSEFTQMFQTPAPPQGGPSSPAGGEFTQFFRSAPGGTPSAPQFPSASQFPQAAATPAAPPRQAEPGDYTRMFGTVGSIDPTPQAPVPPPAPPNAYGGGATQVFAVNQPATPASGAQGPSEYTRMISTPSNLGSLPGAIPPAAPISGMPQMGAPSVPMPPAPQPPAMPQVAPPPVAVPAAPAGVSAGKSPNIVLIVIFCLLAFLAGGVVVYLVVRRG